MSTYDELIKLEKGPPTPRPAGQDKEQGGPVPSKTSRQSPGGTTPPSEAPAKKPDKKKGTQTATRKDTRILKKLSKRLSTEAIERLSFQLRKEPKVRVNADVPAAWKERLNDLAHAKKVGKYELLLYVIAVFLGEENPDEST